MKICFVSFEYPPIKTPQSNRWNKILQHLSQDHCQIRVFNPPVNIANPFFDSLYKTNYEVEKFNQLSENVVGNSIISNKDKSTFKLLKGFKDFLKKRLPFDKSFLWAIKNRNIVQDFIKKDYPDILLTSAPPFGSLVLGYLAKRKFGPRLTWVIDFGDPWSFASDKNLTYPILKFVQFIENRILEKCDAAIFTTKKTQVQYLKQLNKSNLKSIVIYQGADRNLDNNYNYDVTYDLVYTGTFYRDIREPFSLYEAAAQLNRNLIIAGNIDPYFKKIPNGHEGFIKFLGNLDQNVVFKLQRSAKILVFIDNKSSTQLPGKIFEYIASGRPLLCIGISNDSPLYEIDFQQYPIVFCQNSSASIVDAISQLENMCLLNSNYTLDVGWNDRADQARKFFNELL